ncbi:hypothetical protein ACHAXR_008476, partial [Thalassiosira sp. AJA248-18]
HILETIDEQASEDTTDNQDTEVGRAVVVEPSDEVSLFLLDISNTKHEKAYRATQHAQYVEPKNYDGAWNHPDPVQRGNWREAIAKEFSDMESRGVWKKIKRNQMPRDRRPDIANCVRELSKVLDGPTMGSYKELLRIIKYVLDTRNYGLKIWPTRNTGSSWNMTCFTDSDFATDPDTRRSVSGYIIYLHGVPIVWKSKAQKSVTLSSAEAEWFALSEAVKDVMFLLQLCESMNIKVQLPVTVRVDNTATIFMAHNITTSSRTKHIDCRLRYVNEYVEDGIIKIVFVRSEDN